MPSAGNYIGRCIVFTDNASYRRLEVWNANDDEAGTKQRTTWAKDCFNNVWGEWYIMSKDYDERINMPNRYMSDMSNILKDITLQLSAEYPITSAKQIGYFTILLTLKDATGIVNCYVDVNKSSFGYYTFFAGNNMYMFHCISGETTYIQDYNAALNTKLNCSEGVVTQGTSLNFPFGGHMGFKLTNRGDESLRIHNHDDAQRFVFSESGDIWMKVYDNWLTGAINERTVFLGYDYTHVGIASIDAVLCHIVATLGPLGINHRMCTLSLSDSLVFVDMYCDTSKNATGTYYVWGTGSGGTFIVQGAATCVRNPFMRATVSGTTLNITL